MNQVYSKVFNKEIDQTFDHVVSLSRSGVYVVRITASAKSWWQNIVGRRAFLQKDSLTIRIDGQDVLTRSVKKRLFADDIWNGNTLKGNELTVYILLVLDKGDHSLTFNVHGRPTLGEVVLFHITDSVVSIEHLQSTLRDRTPWITFLIRKDSAISSLSITASAGISDREDDDLKIVIDGVSEKNSEKNAHRDWYWCGKILKGAVKKFTRVFDPDQSPQRFDLHGDGTPRIDTMTVNVGTPSRARVPTLDNPLWTGDFRDDPEQIILARALFGEGRSLSELGRIAIGWVIRNRIGYTQWGNNYHDVILHPRHFSAFNKNDPNRVIVENPSRDLSQRNAWKECYAIAVGIIQETIPDPTKGANHYYSTFVKPPFWTRSKGAELTLRVENTLFYRVPQTGKRIIIPALVVALLFGTIGFFALASTRDEPLTLVHEKSTHFSERIADNSVAVYYGCGTECEGIRVFDERTGKQKAEFNYGVGYIWSPDKKYVAAFHSSAGYGFTVGDMLGRELFLYTKPLEKNFDSSIVSQWAPNSSTLAILVQDDETQYDLFVVWGFDDPIRATSVRVPLAKSHTIEWDKTGRVVSVNGTALIEIDESGYGHHLIRNKGK